MGFRDGGHRLGLGAGSAGEPGEPEAEHEHNENQAGDVESESLALGSRSWLGFGVMGHVNLSRAVRIPPNRTVRNGGHYFNIGRSRV